MNKAIILLFCLGVMSTNCLFGQTMIHSELLSKPTDRSISIHCHFLETVDVSVFYGLTSGNLTQQTIWKNIPAGQVAEVVLGGLEPNTQYFYRLAYRNPGTNDVKTRPEFTFHTQRPKGEPFTFVIQADPHLDVQSDTQLYQICLQNQLADKPDFMLDLGDFIMTDKLANAKKVVTRDTIVSRCRLLRSYYENVGHSIPLFIALGNHEAEAGWQLNGTENNMAVWNTLERKKYFRNPSPDGFYGGDTSNYNFVGQRESYYSWSWGDAQFIVLDPYWFTSSKPDSLNGWRWTLGKKQYDWLKTTLENSTATYKFVFSHQLIGGDPDGRGGVEFAHLYEWGGSSLDGKYEFDKYRPGWESPIKDLLTKHKINIFFHGHDHFFGKQEKDCLVYQECPQPSHPNFQNVQYAKAYGYVQGQIIPNSGHVRVSVKPEGIKIEYVRAYLPTSETPTRKNRDISATYYIGAKNCYDSTTSVTPTLWNSDYIDEVIYPNPFREETTIELDLKKSEKLTLSIFGEKGELVKKLLSGVEIAEGKYKIIWDGKNNSENLVPEGVYWYTLQNSQGQLKSGKIVLLH